MDLFKEFIEMRKSPWYVFNNHEGLVAFEVLVELGEGLKDLRIYFERVSDQGRPHLPSVAHRDSVFLDFLI